MAYIYNESVNQLETTGPVSVRVKSSSVDSLYGPYVIEDGDALYVTLTRDKVDESGNYVLDEQSNRVQEEYEALNQTFVNSLIPEDMRPTLQIGRTIGIIEGGQIRELWLQKSAIGTDLEWTDKVSAGERVVTVDGTDVTAAISQINDTLDDHDDRLAALEGKETEAGEAISSAAVNALFAVAQTKVTAGNSDDPTTGVVELSHVPEEDIEACVVESVLLSDPDSGTAIDVVYRRGDLDRRINGAMYYAYSTQGLGEGSSSDLYSSVELKGAGGVVTMLYSTGTDSYADVQMAWGSYAQERVLRAEKWGDYYFVKDSLGNPIKVGDILYPESVLDDVPSSAGVAFGEDTDGRTIISRSLMDAIESAIGGATVTKEVTGLSVSEATDAYDTAYAEVDTRLDWSGLKQYETLRKQHTSGSSVDVKTATDADILALFN